MTREKGEKYLGYFYKVPRTYLETDYKELMVRFCLACDSNIDSYTSVCIGRICEMCGYSTTNRNKTNGSFSSYVKGVLRQLIENEEIIQTWGGNINSVKGGSLLQFKLLDKFFDSQPDNFSKLTKEAFDTLMRIECKFTKATLLKIYTYIRGHIIENSTTTYGFYKSVDIACLELAVSRQTLDDCLDLFVENGLFIRHLTGSCYVNGNPKNVPNIYVLPDGNAQSNIDIILKEMKQRYKVKKFAPMLLPNIKKKEKLSNSGD